MEESKACSEQIALVETVHENQWNLFISHRGTQKTNII